MWHHAADASKLAAATGNPVLHHRGVSLWGPSSQASKMLCMRASAVTGACTQVLQWPNGVPVTSGCGAPVALNNEGLPINGPGGLPCCLGPDGDSLLTWEGRALLGPQVGGCWECLGFWLGHWECQGLGFRLGHCLRGFSRCMSVFAPWGQCQGIKSCLLLATCCERVAACLCCCLQGQVLSLGPNCTLMTADGKHLVGADGEWLCLGPDGVTLVDAGALHPRIVLTRWLKSTENTAE